MELLQTYLQQTLGWMAQMDQITKESKSLVVCRDNLIAGDNDLSDISPFLGGLELNWRIFSKIGCFLLTKKIGDVQSTCITIRRWFHEFVIRHYSALYVLSLKIQFHPFQSGNQIKAGGGGDLQRSSKDCHPIYEKPVGFGSEVFWLVHTPLTIPLISFRC